jgi:hypothetical protein
MDVLMDMDTPPMVIMAVDMDTTWERGPLKLRLLLPLRQLLKQRLMLMPQHFSTAEDMGMEVTDMEVTVMGTEATVLDTDVPMDMDTHPMVMAMGMVMAMAMATTDKKSALHSSQK